MHDDRHVRMWACPCACGGAENEPCQLPRTPALLTLSVTRNHLGTIVNCSIAGVPEDWSDWDLRGELESWVAEDSGTPAPAVAAARLVLTTPMVSMSDLYQCAKGIRVYVDND